MKLLPLLFSLALPCTSIFAQKDQLQIYRLPIVAPVDASKALTNVTYEVPLVMIDLETAEFEKSSRPEDKALSAFLEAVKNEEAERVAGFILQSKEFSIHNPAEFARHLKKTFFRDGFTTRIRASIPLEKGTAYILSCQGKEKVFYLLWPLLPSGDSGVFKVQPLSSEPLLDNLSDYLNASHPWPSPSRKAEEGEFLSWKKLAVRLLTDEKHLAEINETIDRLEASGLREGFAPKSQAKKNDHIARVTPTEHEAETKRYIGNLRKSVCIFDFAPVYVSVLEMGDLAYFYKEGESAMVVVNLSSLGPFDKLIHSLIPPKKH